MKQKTLEFRALRLAQRLAALFSNITLELEQKSLEFRAFRLAQRLAALFSANTSVEFLWLHFQSQILEMDWYEWCKFTWKRKAQSLELIDQLSAQLHTHRLQSQVTQKQYDVGHCVRSYGLITQSYISVSPLSLLSIFLIRKILIQSLAHVLQLLHLSCNCCTYLANCCTYLVIFFNHFPICCTYLAIVAPILQLLHLFHNFFIYLAIVAPILSLLHISCNYCNNFAIVPSLFQYFQPILQLLHVQIAFSTSQSLSFVVV